jgi:hypothetical protein
VVYAVDRIDAERITFNQGGRVESRDGSVLSANTPLAGAMELCLPPGGWTRPNMTSGMSWSADFQRPPGASCAGGFRLRSRVVSEERMPTALGELAVQRVDIEGDIQRTERYTYQTSLKARAFYAPQLARVVRFESELRAAHGPPELELVELIEVRRD